MNAFAETLTDNQRRRGRLLAYCACCCGCISEVMVDSSAIIIIYIAMLGGSKVEIMLSTGFTGFSNMLLMIPCAWLISRIGMHKAVKISCTAGCMGFLLMAAAPWFGAWQKEAILLGCLIYCLQRCLYGSAWYPMLDAFLLPHERGRFFGTMRYTYMIVSGLLFYMLGKAMGKDPPIWLMQLITCGTGVLLLGRMYCMLHFPANPAEGLNKLDLRKSLAISLRNRSLMSYSVYVCMLSITYTSLVPLTLIYLKNHINMEAGMVQKFSTVGIVGNVAAFFCYGFLQQKLKLKYMELLVHIIFIFGALTLALTGREIPHYLFIIGGAYLAISFAASTFMCNNSLEFLALARPGNKTMAIALQQSYQQIGVSVSRICTAALMGAEMLAESWIWCGISLSRYQTIFLFYGAAAAVMLIIFPTLPSTSSGKSRDFYAP